MTRLALPALALAATMFSTTSALAFDPADMSDSESAAFGEVLGILRSIDAPVRARGEGFGTPRVQVGRQVQFEPADYKGRSHFVVSPEKTRVRLVSEDFREGRLKVDGKPAKSVALGTHDCNTNDCILSPTFRKKVEKAGFKGVRWEELPAKGGLFGAEPSFLMDSDHRMPEILGGYLDEDGVVTPDHTSLPGRCLPATGHSPEVYVYEEGGLDFSEDDFLRSAESFGQGLERRSRLSVFSAAFVAFLKSEKIAFNHFPVLFRGDVKDSFLQPVRSLIG